MTGKRRTSTLGNIDELESSNNGDEIYGDAADDDGGGSNGTASDTCVIDTGDTFTGCEH